MKKFLSVMFLSAVLIFAGNGSVEAREVYVGTYSDGTPVYLLDDSLAGGGSNFTCRVRAGYDYLRYHFFMRGGSPYYTNSEGYEGYVYGGQSPVAAAIWEYAH